jgi:hypothetical protein
VNGCQASCDANIEFTHTVVSNFHYEFNSKQSRKTRGNFTQCKLKIVLSLKLHAFMVNIVIEHML